MWACHLEINPHKVGRPPHAATQSPRLQKCRELSGTAGSSMHEQRGAPGKRDALKVPGLEHVNMNVCEQHFKLKNKFRNLARRSTHHAHPTPPDSLCFP